MGGVILIGVLADQQLVRYRQWRRRDKPAAAQLTAEVERAAE
jgi:hypothetical protein